MNFQCGRFSFSGDTPRVMGVLNLTADSFSGDGHGAATAAAIAHGMALRAAGADILDLGAESSRPGASPVDTGVELERLLPVIAGLVDCGAALSVDTCKPEVMSAALKAGADMINDISGFTAPGAIEAVAGGACGLCIMHMQGAPRTMQLAPSYTDVAAEVLAYLCGRAQALEAAGVARARISIDPGFGFGKHFAHNTALFAALPALVREGYPVLVGLSRKSMLGEITGKPVGDRLVASVASAMLAAQRGAGILRVHDVAATMDALKVLQALDGAVTGEE